jgi:hypothetical protein
MLQKPLQEDEENNYFKDLECTTIDMMMERRYILKLINLKYWLERKDEYLKNILQYNKKLFNRIISLINPGFMNLKVDEGRWFLSINKTRTKWCCEEKVWINKARRFCRKWLGYRFDLDKFNDLIIKLHSKFRKDTNWFKEDYACQWKKFHNINILFLDDWFRFKSVATIFYSLFWVMFLDLLFIWYWESYYKKCKGLISLRVKKMCKVFAVGLTGLKFILNIQA